MNDKEEIFKLIQNYSIEQLIKLKLEQIEATKQDIERQQAQAKHFLSTAAGKLKAKGPDGRRGPRKNSRTGQVFDLIRAASPAGITNEGLTNALDWGEDKTLNQKNKRVKMRYITKQMIRLDQIKVHSGTMPHKYFV